MAGSVSYQPDAFRGIPFRVAFQNDTMVSDRPEPSRTDDGETRYSRRTVLRAGGAAVGTVATGTVATGGVAAQNETGTGATDTSGTATDETPSPSPIITMAVTPEQEDVERDLTGMWIHFSRPVEPIQASVSDQCDIVDWGDQDTLTYDAMLIDRRNEVYQQPIQVYLPISAEVGPGDLFIINNVVPCESGYIGIKLEQIGARDIDAGIKPGQELTATGTATDAEAAGGAEEPSGGAGPGFGLFAAAGGLLGAGWFLNRGDGSE